MRAQGGINPTARRLTSMLFGVLVGFTTIMVPTAGADPTAPTKTLDPSRSAVRYQLSGSGVAGYVTYVINDGQAHATNVTLPWSMQLTSYKNTGANNTPLSLSAQSAGPGSITCSITVDGKQVSQNTAAGDPARVVCVA